MTVDLKIPSPKTTKELEKYLSYIGNRTPRSIIMILGDSYPNPVSYGNLLFSISFSSSRTIFSALQRLKRAGIVSEVPEIPDPESPGPYILEDSGRIIYKSLKLIYDSLEE